MKELFEKHYKHFLNFAFSLTKNKEDAEDLVQDVYLKIHDKENINKSFVFVVIKNLFIDQQRKMKDIFFIDVIDNIAEDLSDLTLLRYNVEEFAEKHLQDFEKNLLLSNRTSREISKSSGVSVYKINQVKTKAINKLKKAWEEEENQRDLEML